MSDDELTDDEAAAFRDRCIAFLDEHATGLPVDSRPRSSTTMDAAQAFQGALAEAGLAGLTYDAAYGGAGLTKAHERVYRELYATYPDMTSPLIISLGMPLPVMADFGTDAQKQRFMPKMINGEEVWCQLFSEPGAGSDVSSLQMRAERDGDEFILNGQKVWTTLAHLCDYGMCIVRTDPTVEKHAGLTMVIVDMHAPGVEVRPIHQIDGGQHFNEVFFTDVRIPADWVIGDLNDGWRVATAMLMYERVAIGAGSTGGVNHPFSDRLIEAARRFGTIDDPTIRQDLMRLYSGEVAKSLVALRTRAEMQAGRTPGPGGSLGKLHASVLGWLFRDLAFAVAGPAGQAWEGDERSAVIRSILTTIQMGIAGGTDEIQRNIIGERVLGLPREPNPSKGIPFIDLRVNENPASLSGR